jgi:Na+/citrate or Na+/malate symporter
LLPVSETASVAPSAAVVSLPPPSDDVVSVIVVSDVVVSVAAVSVVVVSVAVVSVVVVSVAVVSATASALVDESVGVTGSTGRSAMVQAVNRPKVMAMANVSNRFII